MKTFELVFPEGLFCGSTSNIACRSCFTPKNKFKKFSVKETELLTQIQIF